MPGTAIEELLTIMARLRDPDTGCPWDQQQTFDSIAPYTIEEAFEVAEAIAERDYPELCEELGDLLLQVVFHAQMASEQGLFQFSDVVATLNAKMIRRHPHVFADSQQAADLGSVKANWEQIKGQERAAKGRQHGSALDGVPAGLPALQRATKLQKKASRQGFDWRALAPVRQQVDAELKELDEALMADNHDAIDDEFGDVLFSLVNLSRHLQLDAEQSLRRASAKFSDRFRRVEQLAQQQEMRMQELDEAALDALWRQAKAQLRAEQ